jgi:Flp pilus assembly protein TadD
MTKFSLIWAFVLAVTAVAQATEADPGAGPIVMRITPCLIAKRTAPCPEPALSLAGDKRQRAGAYLERARFFIDVQNLQQALTEVDTAIELDPDWSDARHLAARISYSMADLARAERDIQHALRLSPNSPNILATRASILETRSPPEALKSFEDIAEKYPDHVFSRAQRGRLLLEARRPGAALRDLDFVLSGDKPWLQYLPLRAKAHLMMGKVGEAINDLSAALRLNPNDPRVLLDRAAAYARIGDDAAALSDYDQVLGPVGGGRPRYALGGDMLAVPLMLRAEILVDHRRYEDAVTDILAAMEFGGTPAVLRAQVFLRRNGFSDLPLDGKGSDAVRDALRSCFGLNACFTGLIRAI